MEMNVTTRRALVKLVGAGAVTASVAGVSFMPAKSEAPKVSSALSMLIARHREADRELDHFYETTYNPAVDRSYAARDAIPHVTITPSANWRMDPAFWSTANPAGVAMARRLVQAEPRTSKRTDVVCARKLVAAMHRRNRQGRLADRAVGLIAAASREHNQLRLVEEIDAAIREFPATSITDLMTKLKFVGDSGGMDGERLLPLMIADLSRVASRDSV